MLDELMVSKATPAQMMTQARARRPLPNRIVLDYACWAAAQTDGRNVYDSFRRATPNIQYVQADKRFPASIVRLNDMMTLEGVEGFPQFCIECGKAPNLAVQLLELQEEDVNPSGGGFKDSAVCDAADTIRYAAMAARGGIGPVITTSDAPKGPLYARIRERRIAGDEIIGWDPLTGAPQWGGAGA